MLVGLTMTGKSTNSNILAKTLTQLKKATKQGLVLSKETRGTQSVAPRMGRQIQPIS